MLVIRLQRTGRKGHAQFRIVVQESRLSPASGRVVAQLGNYDPHTKVCNLDKEQAAKYLTNGAQPSERVARLLSDQGVKLPDWVKIQISKTRSTRKPEKLRKNQPAVEEIVAEEQVEEVGDTEQVSMTTDADEGAPVAPDSEAKPAA